jgi:hypothetical protein
MMLMKISAVGVKEVLYIQKLCQPSAAFIQLVSCHCSEN